MGTRNLTAVMLDGEYRVAQYGQWDGYPSGQGLCALEFLHSISKRGRKKFARRLRECEFIPEDEMAAWPRLYVGDAGNRQWLRDYPYVTRDHGAAVLELIYSRDDKPRLRNEIDFAGQSLMCEYAYVIDFDKSTFEAYKGFNKTPHIGERFSASPTESHVFNDEDCKPYTYAPVKHWRTFKLARLPNKDSFLRALKEDAE